MKVLLEIALWLLRKFGVALAVVAVVLLVGGVYLYLSDELRRESQRGGNLEALRARSTELAATAAAVEAKLTALRTELAAQRQRVETSRRVLASLEAMRSLWERFSSWVAGSPQQEQTNTEMKARAQTQHDDAAAQVEQLAAAITGASAEHNAAVAEHAQLTAEITRIEQAKSPTVTYAQRAWRTLKWPIILALVGFFFGPTIWKVLAYFALAPLIARAAPVRIVRSELPAIAAGASRVSDAVALQPGETVFLKERFLQASDEALRRRTRFVLDWRVPFTCAACGLIELVELRNGGEGHAFVTVSTQDDTMIELSVVHVPSGAAVVLRPSFLAGVVLPKDRTLTIRRHWRLGHLHSWLTLQFRYFEFAGPCRLVVAGSRGVRAERLEGASGGAVRGRRTNQDSTIGFTPDLEYRSARAETFWAYYRNRNPLYDDLFLGRGTFLCQEVATESGPGAKARKFWSRFWDTLLRVFGL